VARQSYADARRLGYGNLASLLAVLTSATNPDATPFALPVSITETLADGTLTTTIQDDVTIDFTGGGVQILAADPTRRSVFLQNTGLGNARVVFDGSAPTSTHGLQMAPGDTVKLSGSDAQALIKGIREAGTSTTITAISEVAA